MNRLKRYGIFLIVLIINSYSLFAKQEAFIETEKTTYEKDSIHTYLHKSSGLTVVWIENKDANKSFVLGVKTPTKDSTGVNHIIEHTIFKGSKKYPNNDLFFDADQHYPHIYMNALTASDMTMYPFCTPYDACYKELLQVYLDSILNPRMQENANSFYEEAFHYNPTTNQFGGVVYNEMKGADNDIYRTIFREIRKTIYKGTHYENDSGGDPNVIPTLTYEDFLATYHTYYYPSNMQVVLYGDLAIDTVLDTLDSYFSAYTKEKEGIDLNISPQIVAEKQKTTYTSSEKDGYLIKSFCLKSTLSAKEALALDLWIDAYLLNANSVFQRQLDASGIKYMNVLKDEDLARPIYSIILSNIPQDKMDYYENRLDKAIYELTKKDVTNTLVEKDILEKAKMSLWEKDMSPTRGIQIGESILDSWAHGKEKYQYFIVNEAIEQMDKLPTDMKQSLLVKSNKANLQLLPTRDKIIMDPLENSRFTKEEWQLIMEEITRWKQGEKKVPLPLVDLEQLMLIPKDTCASYKKNSIHYISVPTQSKLGETSIYLDTSFVQKDKLPYLFLYEYLLNESAKEESPFKAMLGTRVTAVNNGSTYEPYMKVSILSSSENTNHAQVLSEARSNLLSKSANWYTRKLQQFLYGFKEKANADILGNLSVINTGSMQGAKRYEYEKSYPLYDLVEQLLQEKDKEWIQEIRKIDATLYVSDKVTIGITSEKEKIKAYEKSWGKYFKNYGTKDNPLVDSYKWGKMPLNSIFKKDSKVDYLVYSYQKQKEKVDGKDYILASYLTKNYLQPSIRIEKGAYGSGMGATFPYNLALYTYRDPDYKSSIEIIKQMPPFMEKPIVAEDLQAAKADALSTFHRQFGFLEDSLSRAALLQDLTFSKVPMTYLTALQKEIIGATTTDIKAKKGLLIEFIHNASKGICTEKIGATVEPAKTYELE